MQNQATLFQDNELVAARVVAGCYLRTWKRRNGGGVWFEVITAGGSTEFRGSDAAERHCDQTPSRARPYAHLETGSVLGQPFEAVHVGNVADGHGTPLYQVFVRDHTTGSLSCSCDGPNDPVRLSVAKRRCRLFTDRLKGTPTETEPPEQAAAGDAIADDLEAEPNGTGGLFDAKA